MAETMVLETDNPIYQSEAYKGLLAEVEENAKNNFHDYRGKLAWIVERAIHYAEKTGLSAVDILTAWEEKRSYWYMNYYQEANQPKISGDSVRVFETVEDMTASIGKSGFRCPYCKGVSKSPYECDSGVKVTLSNKKGKHPCNWKVYGLFGAMGRGVYVFVKSALRGENIFVPIAWEESSKSSMPTSSAVESKRS